MSILLAGCRETSDTRPEVVLGDQAGLTQAKNDAAGALKGSDYRFRWANFPGAAPLLEALNAGAVDTAVAGDAPLVQAAAGGIPLRIVATLHSSGRAVGILVPRTSAIRSIADLRGKHVIVSTARGSVAHYLLLGALEEAHVPVSALTIGFMMPNEAASAFEAGKIDAWAIFGSYQAIAEARGARLLRDGHGISSGVGVIVASEAALRDPAKRAGIADYLARQARANRWSLSHPDAYAAVYARQTGVPLPVAQTIAAWENPLLSPVGHDDVRSLQHVADRFHDLGMISDRVAIAPLAEPALFPAQR